MEPAASTSPERSPAQSEMDESAPLKGGTAAGGHAGGSGRGGADGVEDVLLDHGVRLRITVNDALVVSGTARPTWLGKLLWIMY